MRERRKATATSPTKHDGVAIGLLGAAGLAGRSALLVVLVLAAPAPRSTPSPPLGWQGTQGLREMRDLRRIDPATAMPPPLQPAQHGAPPLRNVPLGQRLRTEQDCGSCHRIEDRRAPGSAPPEAWMT